MATVGRACLILALALRRTASAPRCTARAPAGATGSTPAAAPVYALAAADDAGLRGPRGRVPALGLLLRTVVATHSSTTTPIFYRAAAAWSSQEGSLLLWVWLLSLWSSLVLFLDAPAPARRRAVRDRRAARLRRVLRRRCSSSRPRRSSTLAPRAGRGQRA